MNEVKKQKLAKELRELFEVKGLEVKPSRFAVYLPSRLSSDVEIHPVRYRVLVTMTKQFLCETLGGLTSYKAKGAWVGKSGQLHEEKVLVMESYCSLDALVKRAKDLRTFANALAIEFEQAQMACVVDGEMVFFEPTEVYRNIHKSIMSKVDDRSMDSIVWKYVLKPLKEAGIDSVHGPIA